MDLSRRSFLKATTVGGAIALGFDLTKADTDPTEMMLASVVQKIENLLARAAELDPKLKPQVP